MSTKTHSSKKSKPTSGRGARRSRTSRQAPAPKPVLRTLRENLQIPQSTMARLLDVSVRTVSTLESAKSVGKKPPRSVIEIQRLLDALTEIMRAEDIAAWLEEENEAFEGLKPLEVIERGEQDRVWQLIHFVASGEPT